MNVHILRYASIKFVNVKQEPLSMNFKNIDFI